MKIKNLNYYQIKSDEVDNMINNNSFTLLKILIQDDFTTEELKRYLSINLSTLLRNIKNLNEYLSSLGIDPIIKHGNKYSLNITEEQQREIFSNLSILFSDQRIEYLFIKILIKGYINLEYETSLLNISRTTIVRDFKSVRNTLKSYNITLKYKVGKGIFIQNKNKDIGFFLIKKLMKIILERDYISISCYSFLPEISSENIKQRYLIYYKVFEKFKISLGDMLFAFVYSIDIISNYFNTFSIPLFEPIMSNIKNDTKFLEIEKYVKDNIVLDSDYIQYISCVIFCLKYRTLIPNEFLSFNEAFFKKLEEYFHIDVDISLKKTISYKLVSYFFRYNNKIISITNIHPHFANKIILDKLEKILEELNTNLYYSDLLLFSEFIKNILIKNSLKEKIKILFLIENYLLIDLKDFSEHIKKISPNIEFSIKPTLYFKFSNEDLSVYDLIVSDQLKFKSIHKVKAINSLEIEILIYNFCLKKALKRIKKSD